MVKAYRTPEGLKNEDRAKAEKRKAQRAAEKSRAASQIPSPSSSISHPESIPRPPSAPDFFFTPVAPRALLPELDGPRRGGRECRAPKFADASPDGEQMVECSKGRHFVRRADLRDDNGKEGRRCLACRARDHAREEERRAEIRREQREANEAEDEREDVRARLQPNVPTPCPPSPSPTPPPATPPDAPEPPIGPKNFLDMPALPPDDEKRCKEFRDRLKTIELELCPVCEELVFNSDVGPVPELDWRAFPDSIKREGGEEALEGGDNGMDVEEEEKVVCKRCRAHLTTNRKAMVKEADGGPPAKPLKFSKANNPLFGTSHNLASEIMLRDRLLSSWQVPNEYRGQGGERRSLSYA